ncbi:MAG: transcriptional repressor [Spirochaetales bacterium]|nr:transcriptional repressor [Spirochaetales bacterium]
MDATELLRQHGQRVTPVRVQVLEALFRMGRPVSPAQLAEIPQLRGCDRVTLYRTLNRLRVARLVHAVEGIDGAWRYCAHPPDTRGCPGDHPHFLCLSCGRMTCLIGQRLPHVEVPPGVQVEGKQLVVYGRCAECARAGKGSAPSDPGPSEPPGHREAGP